MRTAIITTGNEILDGRVLDTNSHYIHKRLQHLSVNIVKSVIVSDDIDLIVREIRTALKESDICFISGGLGPTEDDRTVEAVSKAASLPLIRNEREVSKLKAKLKPKGLPLNESNLKQAHLPQGAEALDNPLGTAPGFYLNFLGKHLFCMPGVPSELVFMFENQIEPVLEKLVKRVNTQSTHIIKTMGISEARLSEIVLTSDIGKNYSWGMTAGHEGIFTSFSLKNVQDPQKEIDYINQSLASVIDQYIYGYNDNTLPDIIKTLALEKKCSLAVAESCTGGLLGKLLTDIEGSSSYFKGGVIAYSNDIKIQLLSVKDETLKSYGAVSVQCAQEMAEGALRLFDTDFTISVTGIAGPGGGTKDKPVGTVCFGIANQKDEVSTYRRVFFGTRDDVRQKSAYNGLNFLRLKMLSST